MRSSSFDWLDQSRLLIALIRWICNHGFLNLNQVSTLLGPLSTADKQLSFWEITHHVSTGSVVGPPPTTTCPALPALILDLSNSVELLLRILRSINLQATCDKQPSPAYFEKVSSIPIFCLQSERLSIRWLATACCVFVVDCPSVRENHSK